MTADRRRFCTTILAVAAAVVSGGIAVRQLWRAARGGEAQDARARVARHLREELRHLSLGDEAVERYLDDLERHRDTIVRHAVADRRDVVERFLLSTDFFPGGADAAARPLVYRAFYHPYVTPCWNPMGWTS